MKLQGLRRLGQDARHAFIALLLAGIAAPALATEVPTAPSWNTMSRLVRWNAYLLRRLILPPGESASCAEAYPPSGARISRSR